MRGFWNVSAVALLVACSGGDKDSSSPGTNTNPNPGTPAGTVLQPPRAENDLATVDEGGSVTVAVSANDLVGSNPLALGSVTVVTPPANGTLQVQPTGSVDYTHDGSETSADSFTYTIEDDAGTPSNVASVTLTVAPVNDPPVAVDDSGNTSQGQTVNLPLLDNDSDPDNGLDMGGIAIVTSPSAGTVTVNADGSVDYTHDGSGTTTDSFTYTASDVSGAVSNTATVSLTISTVNAPPSATDDFVAAVEGALTNLNVLYNDTDPDDGLDPGSVSLVSAPGEGTATVLVDGSIDYQHSGSESGSDSFTYTVADMAGQVSNTATVFVGVTGVNDPPVASDDSGAVTENQSVNLDVLANDSDPDDGLDVATVTVVTQPTAGTVTVLVDGSIDFQHDGSQVLADSFTYTVDDLSGATSNVATVDVAITLVNDPPVASNDGATVAEGGTVVVDLAANDTDSDDGVDLGSIAVTSGPSAGTVTVLGGGTVEYQHDGSEGASDQFTYTIADVGGGTSNAATVSLTVTPVNDPPTAAADNATVDEGSSVTVDVLANDSDPDDGLDPGSVLTVSSPAHGTLLVLPTGDISYSHDGGETVSDSFTYRVSDYAGAQTSPTTVSVTITPVNDPPVAVNDSAVGNSGSTFTIDVLANDSDVDGTLDVNSPLVVSSPANGIVFYLGGGVFEYSNFGGPALSDSFTYVVSDNQGASSNPATVSLTLNPVANPPVANDDHGRVATEVWSSINLAGNDTDPVDVVDPATLNIVSGPSNGTLLTYADGTVDYLHDYTSGTFSDSFTYTIDSTTGATSNVATVTVEVSRPSQCVVHFDEVYGAANFDPNISYGPYGLDFQWSNTVGSSQIIGGMGNGDPGNWDIEGTNGTVAWGMWFGPHALAFAEPVVDLSMDFTRASQDQSFTVDAWYQGTLMASQTVNLVGAFDVQTVSFAGPVDEVTWSWASSFMGLDDIRYSAPTLPCPGRVQEITVEQGTYFDNQDVSVWANRGYTFVAEETFSIVGGAWLLDLSSTGTVRLDIYDSAGLLLASGTTGVGVGSERWIHSSLDFTFQAGQTYTASFYTNEADFAVMDRYGNTVSPVLLDGLVTVIDNGASGSGNGAPASFPGGGNSWKPVQRLIRDVEVVDNLGSANGNSTFDCPPFWRLPNSAEFDLVDDFFLPTDPFDYYTNVAIDVPGGCSCKWNETYCGIPSIETYDGRMCGDFAQLHMCVEDR